MSTLLLICEDVEVSENIIQKMSSQYSIWHVRRQRDAMAWLKNHQPESVIMDLDLLGLGASDILNQIRQSSPINCTLAIGLCKSPEPLSPLLLEQFDQLIVNYSI